MKKENSKRKLFENLIKLNPELKNNAFLNEEVLNGFGVKFRAEVTGKGENVWSGNAMEYDTEDEAKQWLDGLAGRWFGFDMSRVVPVSVPKGQPVDFENDEFYQNFRAGLNEKDDKWIQKAVDPKHKGYCTPMTKDTCTPARKAFAKRAKAGDLEEEISVDVEVGDTVMTGRFKNKRTEVKSIGKDEHDMPTINGKKAVTFRKGVKDESVNEDIETWKNDITPSNQEHFAKQAQGLGMSPQEMYDEMKAEENAVRPQQLNEAKLSREDMMAALKSKFGLSHVDTTENFDGTEGGIWLSGENGETAKDGSELFDYYSTNYNKYEFGVHNDFNKFAKDNGWYAEWYDPGTLMLWED